MPSAKWSSFCLGLNVLKNTVSQNTTTPIRFHTITPILRHINIVELQQSTWCAVGRQNIRWTCAIFCNTMSLTHVCSFHTDIMVWQRSQYYWPIVMRIQRSPLVSFYDPCQYIYSYQYIRIFSWNELHRDVKWYELIIIVCCLSTSCWMRQMFVRQICLTGTNVDFL